MKKIFEYASRSIIVRVTGFIILSVIPAFDFYKNLMLSIFGDYNINSISIGKNIIDIITGLLLGGIFLLFLQSKNEYSRIKKENQRIREMLLTIHIFNNIRFSKLANNLPTLFQNEEQLLRKQLSDVLKHDIGREYSSEEINELLDCFYRGKSKFN